MRSQLDPSDILDPDLGTILVGPYDHIFEFLSRRQPAFGSHLVGKLGTRHSRWAADLACRGNHILLLDCLGDVWNGQAQLGQLVRLDPYAHGVITAAQHAGLSNTLDAGYSIKNIDRQVITLEILIIGAFGRVKRYQQQGEREFFLNGNPQPFYFFRNTGLRFGNTVLHQHVGHVEVGTHLEGNRQVHGAVIGVDGFHVERVFYAVDFLFQRCRHRLFDNFCVGAGISDRYAHFRWCDFGILGDR